MYHIIYKYLQENKQLALPGIGVLQTENSPAETVFTSRTVSQPFTDISLADKDVTVDKTVYAYISKSLGVTDLQAVQMFNDFVFDIKNKCAETNQLPLPGIGTLRKSPLGKYSLLPEENPFKSFTVTAEKIVQQNAEHTIRVGEDEKTNVQMQEYFEERKTTGVSKKWLIGVAILTVLAAAAIGYYYFVMKKGEL